MKLLRGEGGGEGFDLNVCGRAIFGFQALPFPNVLARILVANLIFVELFSYIFSQLYNFFCMHHNSFHLIMSANVSFVIFNVQTHKNQLS